MIKAILADDEPIIIKGLKKLIPWEQYGVIIAGEAWTGAGLLALIEREEPGLVITDISMPDGSGIDVIKEIGQRRLRTKVIFISAYQEFSYAKDALAYGAVDYLVKPVEKEHLSAAVQRAVSELQEETEELTYKSKLALLEHKNKQMQLEELFDHLAEGDIRPEEAKRKLAELDAGYVHERYSILLIEAEQPGNDDRWGEHEKRLLLFAVSNLAAELIHRYAEGLIFRKADRLCAVVNHPAGLDLAAVAREILENARRFLKVDLDIGIGRHVEGIESLKSAHASALEAMEYCFFEDGGASVVGPEGRPKPAAPDRELSECKQAVLQALLARDAVQVEERLDRFFELAETFAGGSRAAAVTYCYTSALEWVEELTKLGIDCPEPGHDRQAWLAILQSLKRYGSLKEHVRTAVQDILRAMESGGSGKEAQQLQTVKAYIETHYMENVTLESMAAMMYMNPYYFSSFFKKHTGMNFKQYLTEIRMKHAVRLLLQTDLRVYEIAEQVGYNNARQFSDMFKKQYGKLPQEYKNSK